MTTEAERMTAYWTYWRVLWHRILGHEITHSSPDYPPPICRTCELERLRASKKENLDHMQKCPECEKHYLCREIVCRLVCANCEKKFLKSSGPSK